MTKKLKLGSLFSGIGGFEYIGQLYDIEPVWASEVEPACIRITKRHFPNMKHLGDITKIHGNKIEPVDIITGGSPCFPAGTMVLTKSGYIPIEDIQIGDFVLTHKGRWRKVSAIGNRKAETYYLKGNINIETTANHPIYSADIKRIWDSTSDSKGYKKHLINIGQWTSAVDMEGKQWATPITAEPVIIPMGDNPNLNQKPMPELNEDFWYFVGRWIDDGWVRNGFRKEKPGGKGYGIIYLCDSFDKENELINIVSKMSDNYSIEQDKTVIKAKFTSQVLCKWLVDNFGKDAINKTIPGWALSMSHKYRKILFDGIMDSDGWRKSDTSMKVTSISKRLILGIRMLAESLGYSTSVSYYKRPEKKVIEGRTVNQHDTYSVAIHDNKNRKTGLEYNGHKWYKCRNVIKTGEIKTVYNISVEEDESYIADSIVVHNCQDLSVAGKQNGIKLKCIECSKVIDIPDKEEIVTCPECGADVSLTRSGLFMEQVRIIKEMRNSTNECFPKIVIWENVPGALSSNDGYDFQKVLEEFCGLLAEKLPSVKPDRWSNAGQIMGKSGSIAWRILDAQYWGVPQRRRRIFLVIDFGGQRAGEILFKQESMRRYHTPSRAPWKRITSKIKNSTGKSNTKIEQSDDIVYCLQGNGIDRADTAGCNGKGWKENICYTLNTVDKPAVVYGVSENMNGDVWTTDNKVNTLTTGGGKPGQGYPCIMIDQCNTNKPYVAAFRHQQGACMGSLPYCENLSPTLISSQTMAVVISEKSDKNITLLQNHPADSRVTIAEDNVVQTLSASMGTGGGNVPMIIEDRSNIIPYCESGFATYNEGSVGTLRAMGGHYGGGSETLLTTKSIVRRLTPLECERLQGFEDNWTAGESDSARYKALGNSVALPCVDYVISGVAEILNDTENS